MLVAPVVSVHLSDSTNARLTRGREMLWSPILLILFGVVVAAPFAYRAVRQRELADREQVTYGMAGLCHESGTRGRQTYCDYSFQIGDRRFGGMSQSDSELAYGQDVQVITTVKILALARSTVFLDKARRASAYAT